MTPGLLFVSSGIRPESSLTDDVFNKWYDTVHMPDIIATSGVESTYRYKRTDGDTTHPYLSLCPLSDVDFAQTMEIRSVPLTHEMLPGPTHHVFASAEFAMRLYLFVKTVGSQQTRTGPAPYLYIVGQSVTNGREADYEKILDNLILEISSLRRARQYKLVKDIELPGSELGKKSPTHMTLFETNDKELLGDILSRVKDSGCLEEVPGEEKWSFKLLGGFGDIENFPRE